MLQKIHILACEFQAMAVSISIALNDGLFLRDPQASDLGRRIIKHSILLIDKLGFESFTFKKLAQAISSTEASVYRYFENKHMLLVYLVNWYWEWVQYLIEINTRNIVEPRKKLKIVIKNMVHASLENPEVDYVNEAILHRILVNEGSKAYHTTAVDRECQDGLFHPYEDLVGHVAGIIGEIKPDFPYKKSLASNLFEMANNQGFFAEHLSGLTDIKGKRNRDAAIEEMIEFFAMKLLS